MTPAQTLGQRSGPRPDLPAAAPRPAPSRSPYRRDTGRHEDHGPRLVWHVNRPPQETGTLDEHVLGLRPAHTDTDFWVSSFSDGQNTEVFGTATGQEQFTTGPVVGFAVGDLPAAVDDLRKLSSTCWANLGPTWQQFRGPDGNVYALAGLSQSVSASGR